MDNFSQLPDEKQRYAVEIFANAIAAAHLAAESIDSFPVGSVIVKEKLEIGESNNTPNNLGVMIKRPAGFFPQGGDWEFQYVTPDGRVNNDRKSLANCYACHLASTGTAALDLVFAGAGYMDMAIELRRRLGHHESIWLKIEAVRGSEDRLIAGTRVSLIARQDSGGSSVEEVLVRDARVALDFRYLLEQNLLTIPQDSRNNFILAIPPVSRPAIQNAAGKASLILDFKESDQSVSWIARAAHVRREREKERRYRQMRAPKVTVDGEIHVLDNGELRKESK
jgi:hypothetical protein